MKLCGSWHWPTCVRCFRVFPLIGSAFCWSIALGTTTYQPHQDRCVQYHVRKKMFLIKKELVWGMNCEIAAEVQTDANQVSVKVTIPVEKFNTGNDNRDEDVKSILKYAEHPRMTFVSQKISLESLKTALEQGQEVAVPGMLKIGGRDFPVTFKMSLKKEGPDLVFSGRTEAAMSQFEIPPPRMAGGLIASVEDWLELSFNIHGRHVVGLAELGLTKK